MQVHYINFSFFNTYLKILIIKFKKSMRTGAKLKTMSVLRASKGCRETSCLYAARQRQQKPVPPFEKGIWLHVPQA